jgi:hypothetical protein
VILRDTFMSATLERPTTRATMTAKAKGILANFIRIISEEGLLNDAVACALESSLQRLTALLHRR